mgnify:CR=1 FL=1
MPTWTFFAFSFLAANGGDWDRQKAFDFLEARGQKWAEWKPADARSRKNVRASSLASR